MKSVFGLFGFYVAAMVGFRIAYGAWPPHEGKFADWLFSDSRAQMAMLVGVGAGMIGGIVARGFARYVSPGDPAILEAEALVRRGLAQHEHRQIEPARQSFIRAIELYALAGRSREAAPVY